MSRLLAFLTRENADDGLLLDFRALSEDGRTLPGSKRGHRAGWGIAYYDANGPHYAGRGIGNAFEDFRYVDACRLVKGNGVRGCLLSHLRKADDGAPEDISNTQPFIRHPYTFAHDARLRTYQPELPADLQPKGATPSEFFFGVVLRRIEEAKNVVEGLVRAIGDVRSACESTGMAILMSDGAHLYAFREAGIDETYYYFCYGRRGQSVLVSQEPRWELEWEEVPSGALLVVGPNLTCDIRQIL
ncbi:MAG: class II glutamine amidotransferase [Candidatus Schekmanbacteria bacterium]|nr:class II glutamine amidotransferase [Candidatus Schekmanbacteria bacterium]